MSTYETYSTGVYRDAPAINQAMARVYGYMATATIISMLVSMFIGTNHHLVEFFFTGIMHWVVILSPLAAVFAVGYVLGNDPSKSTALLCLYGFSALMGLSLGIVFAVYTMASIASAFMGAAVLFVVMSGYGYFTKRNLDSIGKYALIALIAIIIVSLINIFIGSSVLQMVVSAIAILVFLALTAYDTQQIREMVSVESGHAVEVMGALTLYLDFINLFINLLQLFGVLQSKDD